MIGAWAPAAALLAVYAGYVWHAVQAFIRLPPPRDVNEPADFGVHQPFEATTVDGRRIAGLVVRPPAPTQSTGVVVLCHPWGLTKERCFSLARLLVERGRTVALFDFRNCGSSETRLSFWPEPLDRGVLDLEAVVAHVRLCLPEHHEGLSLVGLSYGGNVALACADRLNPAPQTLVLDSTPLTPYRHFIATTLALTRARQPLGRLLRWTEPVSARLADALLRGDRFYRRAIESSQSLRGTRLLYIVGEKEAYFSLTRACHFVQTHYRGPMEIWRVPRGRHLTNHISGGKEYARRIEAVICAGGAR